MSDLRRHPGDRVTQVIPSRALRHRARRPPARGAWRELPLLLLVAVVLAVLVKSLLIQAFYIPSRSMQPSLEVGDRVLVNRLAYLTGQPRHGDVVVFERRSEGARPDPGGPLSWVRRAVAQGLGGTPPGSEDLIKRVVGLPGDTLEGRGGVLWRNGVRVAEPYLPAGTVTSDFAPVTVAPGELWVMGDNRGDSADSRVLGPIPQSSLIGRAIVRVWPPGRLQGL